MSAWEWPQWAALAMLVFTAGVRVCIAFGAERTDTVQAQVIGLAGLSFFLWVVWMGGFWG